MSTYRCPKGHKSTESDFCSECGAKIQGIPELLELAKNAIASKVTPEICPACSAPREPDTGDFCEICGYNFVSGAHGEVPITISSPPVQFVEQQGKSPIVGWEVVVKIDSSLRHPNSPEPPINQEAIAFRLNKETNLIGRNSQVRAVNPEIALDFDGAVSHRHAVLNLQADGGLTLRDIGSSNGTQFKGVELEPMTDVPLQDGDEFTLGHWTRIIVQAIRQLS
ncbi:FHA domain-containing protein [Cylindrospermum stagnale PCC 7417]|uniref:FHA domain-containing protein n=1 Tax=Cylindrospermum stagnale PCC 7417 TaxID=56107 RepID=K9X051_9NOST|nr:FHA domain-containing protein [Cylindrospermum stagnale]AFZ25431.1 FHA domain-containing protein [Cylindrospermum stagnale PCC 7417]